MESQVKKQQEPREADLARMKRRATGLFIGVTLVFVAALLFPGTSPMVPYIRATAEAAMIGALADWFAVTALFRYPLGIKIPHTAIIPRRKTQIGVTLGKFFQSNFLNGEVIGRKLDGLHLSSRIASWLSSPDNSGQVAKIITSGAPVLVRVMEDDTIKGFISRSVYKHLNKVPVAPLAGQLITTVMTREKGRLLLVQLIVLIGQFARENETIVRDRIRKETPWWLPVPIDDKVFNRLMAHIEMLSVEIVGDDDHPLHLKFTETVEKFAVDLQNSEDVIAKVESVKLDVLQSIIVPETVSHLLQEIKDTLLTATVLNSTAVQETLQEGITRIGEAVSRHPELLAQIDNAIKDIVGRILESHGAAVNTLIEQTVGEWDPEATARRIEMHIGRDLQFIRINGTIIGGLVGLLLFLLTEAIR